MGRTYKTPIGSLPSVTTILGILNKPALIPWAVKLSVEYLEKVMRAGKTYTPEKFLEMLDAAKSRHRKIKQAAAITGTQVHDMLEKHILARLAGVKPPKETHICYKAFVIWEEKEKWEWIASEETVWSKKGYAGTLDAIAKKDGETWLIDFKTSNRIYEEYIMQLAAYKHAYEERTGTKVDKAGIFQTNRETGVSEWKVYTKKELGKALKAFNHLTKFYTTWKKK